MDDAEAQFAALAEQHASLSVQLATAEEGLEVARAQFLRLNADFDNFRKRTVRLPAPLPQGAAGWQDCFASQVHWCNFV